MFWVLLILSLQEDGQVKYSSVNTKSYSSSEECLKESFHLNQLVHLKGNELFYCKMVKGTNT